MNVTPCAAVPIAGVVLAVVNVNVPTTLAVPLLSVELAKVCPYVIPLAVGATEIVGVTLLTVST